MIEILTHRRSPRQSELALWFFLLAAGVIGVAAGLAEALIVVAGRPATTTFYFPPAFVFSTLFLIGGSVFLHRSVEAVRVEKQKRFRRSLVAALVCGTLFVAVQSYALWCLMSVQVPAEASVSASTFVFTFAVLHAIHFSVALLCLVFISLHGFTDRYDHEYYWGVTVCGWFWHALLVVWLVILGVFALVV